MSRHALQLDIVYTIMPCRFAHFVNSVCSIQPQTYGSTHFTQVAVLIHAAAIPASGWQEPEHTCAYIRTCVCVCGGRH